MLANQNVIIVGSTVVLVPYRPEHVPKYHEWMQSKELQELTASEPLSLAEEYEMQESWRVDEDKLTFIIHALKPEIELTDPAAVLTLPMIGDVNLFLKGSSKDEDFEVEVEVMIAELSYRRQGRAAEALEILLSYATGINESTSSSSGAPLHDPLPVPADQLVVRIGADNKPSIALFESLGFAVTKHVEVFNETELRYREVQTKRRKWRSGIVKQIAFV